MAMAVVGGEQISTSTVSATLSNYANADDNSRGNTEHSDEAQSYIEVEIRGEILSHACNKKVWGNRNSTVIIILVRAVTNTASATKEY